VRELAQSEKASLLCLQEMKLDVMDRSLLVDMLGLDFDYFDLPAVGTCRGILVAWDRNVWDVSYPRFEGHSLSVKVTSRGAQLPHWSLTPVYGPQDDAEKVAFLQELHDTRASLVGPWVLCGDFNLIYQAQDKNNDRLSRRMMGRFRSFLNDLELDELLLHGRLFTWSNERSHPTLERIDRMFVSSCWNSTFPRATLQALSSRCSDHAPLLLLLDDGFHPKRRFRFQAFWPQFEGYLQTVESVWNGPRTDVDVLRMVDHLLQRTAKAMQQWSAKAVGNIKSQITVAKEVIFQLEAA
jgi:exonuclease III